VKAKVLAEKLGMYTGFWKWMTEESKEVWGSRANFNTTIVFALKTGLRNGRPFFT
jgi:hypothetical protein